MMNRIMTSTLTAAALAIGGHAVAQNIPGVVDNPGQPDPTDRGGVFNMIGCLQQDSAATGGAPAMFKIVDVTTGTGEGRMAVGMGAGVPVGRGDSRANQPTDPPDIVVDEYRVVASEDVDLAEHVGKQVELRGSLSRQGAAAATDAQQSAAGAITGRDNNQATAGQSAAASAAGEQVFIATEVIRVSDTCDQGQRAVSEDESATPAATQAPEQDQARPGQSQPQPRQQNQQP